MRNLKLSDLVEAGLWIGIALFLYVYSFEFDRNIEIYKFGASAWPRALLLLVVVAALGQLYQTWKKGEADSGSMIGQASDDGAEDAAEEAEHNTLAWYLWTILLMAIPFAYMLVPDWIGAAMGLEKAGLHPIKMVCAIVLLVAYVFLVRGNHLGGMLALPILFAAFLQDYGFYAMAPLFIVGVMFLMGERRISRMLIVAAIVYAFLLGMFLSLLYVGLPTGNISPFYEFGTGMVNLLQ